MQVPTSQKPHSISITKISRLKFRETATANCENRKENMLLNTLAVPTPQKTNRISDELFNI